MKLTQSITDETYNEAQRIIENDSVVKGFGYLFHVQNTTDLNKPFHIIISGNGNGSCKGATCPCFIAFKVCQNILTVYANLSEKSSKMTEILN